MGSQHLGLGLGTLVAGLWGVVCALGGDFRGPKPDSEVVLGFMDGRGQPWPLAWPAEIWAGVSSHHVFPLTSPWLARLLF